MPSTYRSAIRRVTAPHTQEPLSPNIVGKSLLDIGAWDGYFSFAAERRGAARVVALDHFVWAYKHALAAEYVNECRANGTAVRRLEAVLDKFVTMDLTRLGSFDVVLFLGVIESEMVYLPGFETRAFTEFFATDELSGDHTNWWAPNMTGLIGLARHAGFREVRVMKGPPAHFSDLPLGHDPAHYRGIVHARV